MKIFSLFLVLFLVTGAFARGGPTFTELRGMEDSLGNTHLFYRKHTLSSSSTSYFEHNDIYHLDLTGGIDTLFLRDYYEEWSSHAEGEKVEDFEFWDNDLFRYIHGGAHLSIDPSAYISRWDTTNLIIWVGFVHNIEISHQNDSLVYASLNGGLIKSMDGGFHWDWDTLSPNIFPMVALSPFNDQVLFAVKDYKLYKSINGGTSSFPVDSSVSWIGDNTRLFFDPDSTHIFAVTGVNIQSHLLRSDDAGDSWQVLISDTLAMHLTVDAGQSGTVYLSIGNDVFYSNNYGANFTPYWSLSRPVVGMYKKPQSDLLYAATIKTLYEVTPADTQAIKQLPLGFGRTEPRSMVRDFELYQNYPNPFNPTTNISWQLAVVSQVELTIYNLVGQKIRTLVNARKSAGTYQVQWDGRNSSGQQVASGVYIYRLQAGEFTASRKMLLLR